METTEISYRESKFGPDDLIQLNAGGSYTDEHVN